MSTLRALSSRRPRVLRNGQVEDHTRQDVVVGDHAVAEGACLATDGHQYWKQ
ncbi:MAG: hypothetical protein IPO60_18305 [Flavobacteriales bacterium]|nr:hypothetical protein [Flavobacteriales bacterium]